VGAGIPSQEFRTTLNLTERQNKARKKWRVDPPLRADRAESPNPNTLKRVQHTAGIPSQEFRTTLNLTAPEGMAHMIQSKDLKKAS
jgi:hypothetical protein